MKTSLLAAIVLGSGCMVESPGTPVVQHPMASLANDKVCADERAIGSNIERTVCREPPAPDEKALDTMWHNTLPASPFRGGSQATDTPGVRVYH